MKLRVGGWLWIVQYVRESAIGVAILLVFGLGGCQVSPTPSAVDETSTGHGPRLRAVIQSCPRS